MSFEFVLVLDKKYGTFLQNIPIRHIFFRVPSNEDGVKKQLMELSKMDMYNYFILGSIETIEKVLSVGTRTKMNTNKYAWYAMTKDNIPEIKCNNCIGDMQVMYMYPMKNDENKSNKRRVSNIRRNFGVDAGSDVDVAFYFDVGFSTLKAIR